MSTRAVGWVSWAQALWICAALLLAHPAPPSVGAEDEPTILLGQPWQEERPPVLLRGLTIDTGAYQYGDPSPAEQAHLERINRARLDPRAEAERLLGGDLNEGITDPTLQISLTPKQPLTGNALLHAAARAHSRDMIDQDYFDHLSLDGRTPWDRMAAAGYVGFSAAAENIALSFATYPLDETATLLAMHDRFVVDANTEGRGHRIALFDDGLREIGVGAAGGGFTLDNSAYPFAWALTCDFAARWDGSAFVLGVVYEDRNGDGAYTAGEGLGGVAIRALRVVDGGTAETTTASAGGYGLPLPPATYEVTATLADGRQSTQSLTLADRNVKIDFRAAEFVVPRQCGMAGDVNGDGAVGPEDAVLALQIVAGRQTPNSPCLEAAVTTSGRIGLAEAVYALGVAASR